MFDPITNEEVLALTAAKRSSFTQANLFALRTKYAVCNSEPAAQTAHDQTQAWAVPVHA